MILFRDNKYSQKGAIWCLILLSLSSTEYNVYKLKFTTNIRDTKGDINPLEHPPVLDIAKRYNKNAGQVLLRNLLQKDLVVICCTRTEERIKSNIQVIMSFDYFWLLNPFKHLFLFWVFFFALLNDEKALSIKPFLSDLCCDLR